MCVGIIVFLVGGCEDLGFALSSVKLLHATQHINLSFSPRGREGILRLYYSTE